MSSNKLSLTKEIRLSIDISLSNIIYSFSLSLFVNYYNINYGKFYILNVFFANYSSNSLFILFKLIYFKPKIFYHFTKSLLNLIQLPIFIPIFIYISITNSYYFYTYS